VQRCDALRCLIWRCAAQLLFVVVSLGANTAELRIAIGNDAPVSPVQSPVNANSKDKNRAKKSNWCATYYAHFAQYVLDDRFHRSIRSILARRGLFSQDTHHAHATLTGASIGAPW
jgi:hypothetical protein